MSADAPDRSRTPDPDAGVDASTPVVSVITPTFNEAENVGLLVERLHDALRGVPHEIVVSDDDSPDGTWEVAEALAAEDPSIVVMRRFHDAGLSASVLDGMSVARGEVLAEQPITLSDDAPVELRITARGDAYDFIAELTIGKS